MQIDRKKFFDGYRAAFGKLEQGQVDGLEFLLGKLEVDPDILWLSWAAYMLATVKRETAATYRPIREFGRGRGRDYGRPHHKTGLVYYGRGYVQLTWYANYLTMGRLLGHDLTTVPELACDPDTAYDIMSFGMRKGLFTGKSLGDYLTGEKTDYLGARRIINGMDHAAEIATDALQFEAILKSAIVGEG